MTSGPTAENAKIRSLEGLRGVMAWWVVLGHVSVSFGWNLGLIDHNVLAVDVFIMLSGFVIARLVERKAEPYSAYIVRRGFRLFPLYLAVLLVSTLLLPVQGAAWQSLVPATPSDSNRVALVRAAYDHLPAHVAIHAVLAQGLVPRGVLPMAAYTIVGQAWSISLEWQFYLIAPLLVGWLIAPRRWLAAIGLTIVLIVASRGFGGAFLGSRIALFEVGMASYLAIARSELRRAMTIAAVAGGVVTVALGDLLELIPLAIWAIVLLSSTARPHQARHGLASLLGSRPMAHLGEISYSVYLVHMIPLYVAIWAFGRVGLSGPRLAAAATVATIVGAYGIARATYATIEKPGIAAGAALVRERLAPMRRETREQSLE